MLEESENILAKVANINHVLFANVFELSCSNFLYGHKIIHVVATYLVHYVCY